MLSPSAFPSPLAASEELGNSKGSESRIRRPVTVSVTKTTNSIPHSPLLLSELEPLLPTLVSIQPETSFPSLEVTLRLRSCQWNVSGSDVCNF